MFAKTGKSQDYNFHLILISILLECAVDSDVINFVVSCSVAELFIHRNHKSSLQWPS